MKTRREVTQRVDRFVSLACGPDPVDLQVSEQTREHLREVSRLFIATQPGTHGVPFDRLSTATLNRLVFALLTYIAELKGDHSVMFAMEEPEIALPPYAQRRLVGFVTQRMGRRSSPRTRPMSSNPPTATGRDLPPWPFWTAPPRHWTAG